MEQRTAQQNKSLHKYFTQVAEELDRNGVSFQKMVQAMRNAEVRPTPHNVKAVWHEFQKALLGKESTTQLTTAEVDRVYEVFNMWLGREFETHIPFPSQETEMEKAIREY